MSQKYTANKIVTNNLHVKGFKPMPSPQEIRSRFLAGIEVVQVAEQLRSNSMAALRSALNLQDLMQYGFYESGNYKQSLASPAYRALLKPVMLGHRFCFNFMEFASSLALVHGQHTLLVVY